MTELQLKELLSEMSLGEKIEQMIQFHGGFYGDVYDEACQKAYE